MLIPLMSSPAGPVSLHLQNESGVCAKCGSTSRVGRGLCLKCLLSAGINGNGEHPAIEPTLDDLLRDIQGQDADWLSGIIKFWKKLDAAGWA